MGRFGSSGFARWGAGIALALIAVLVAGGCFGPPAVASECPNETTRERQGVDQGSSYLPDCMALEMVSPPGKGGQPATTPSISSDGERVLFRSRGALGGTPGLLEPLRGDLYVAGRTEAGWSTAATSPPGGYGFVGGELGGPELLTPDFGRWISRQATATQKTNGQVSVFEGELDGRFRPRSELLHALDGFHDRHTISDSRILAASADLSHLVYRPSYDERFTEIGAEGIWATYLPGDPEGEYTTPGYLANSYLLGSDPSGAPTISLLARDASGKAWGGTCGSWVGGEDMTRGERNQGAVSADGSRLYFSTRPAQSQPDAGHPNSPQCDASNPIRILERRETASGPQISELVPGGPAAGDDYFEGASVDGSKVLFTTSRQLTSSDHDPFSFACLTGFGFPGCDLYLYDSARPAGERLTDVSAGDSTDPTPGEGAAVFRGVTAISTDGSHVYFVAQGVLTESPNPEGAVAQQGAPNLYLYERDAAHSEGRTAFVGTVASADGGSLFGSERSFESAATAVPLRGQGAGGGEVGGDGRVLVFESKASLTSDDTDGGRTDVFRYDAANDTLSCVSCAPGGADAQPFDVAPRLSAGEGSLSGPDFAERGRWVSEDGNTIAFATAEPLVSSGSGEGESSYLWRSGGLYRLPGATSGTEPPVPTVSASGNEVAFGSMSPLLPEDGDTAEDIYLARADGGFATPPATAACQGEACQGPASPAGPAPSPSSSAFQGKGNVRHKPKHKPKKHRHRKHRRHEHGGGGKGGRK